MIQLRTSLGIACLVAASCTAGNEQQSSGVALDLTALGEGKLEYRLTNGSDVPTRVVRWRTPLTGTQDDFFSITQRGQAVRYRGPAVFRVPSDSDELVLEPGASLAATVDLNDTYELTAGAPLEVRSRLSGGQIAADGEPAIDVSSALAHVEPPREQGDVVGTAAALQGSCSDNDETYLRATLYSASWLTVNALDNYAPDSELALRYFGQGHDENRARSTMSQMWRVAGSDQLTFMCDGYLGHCGDPGIVAWVFDDAWRTGDWTIHICSRYGDPDFVKPVDDATNASSTGVLVHELAHLGGAWWEGYGEQTVKDTAQNASWSSTLLGEAYRYYVMYQGR